MRKGTKKHYLETKPERIKKLFKAIANGLPYQSSCAFANVCETSFYDWKKRGKKDHEQLQKGEREDETIFSKFYQELMHHEVVGEFDTLNDIKKQGKDDWRASAWLLERRHPNKYGNISKFEHKIEKEIIKEKSREELEQELKDLNIERDSENKETD